MVARPYFVSRSSCSSRLDTLPSSVVMVAFVRVRTVFSSSCSFSLRSLFCLSREDRWFSNFWVTDFSAARSPCSCSACKQGHKTQLITTIGPLNNFMFVCLELNISTIKVNVVLVVYKKAFFHVRISTYMTASDALSYCIYLHLSSFHGHPHTHFIIVLNCKIVK